MCYTLKSIFSKHFCIIKFWVVFVGGEKVRGEIKREISKNVFNSRQLQLPVLRQIQHPHQLLPPDIVDIH